MFLQRLITSLILVPLVLAGILMGPPWMLGAVIVIILVLAGTECWQLIPINSIYLKSAYLLALIASVWVCGEFYSQWLILGLALWGLIVLAILSFPASQRFWGYNYTVAAVTLCLLPLFVQSLIHLYGLPQGKALLVYLLFLIWAADVGAYLAGKRFGAHKMIPQVSPGKSWEGLLGGVVLSLLIALAGYYYFKPSALVQWFALAGLCIVVSVVGDLFISILKRRSQVKDTGAIIPGHGGILDRLDSLIAALPWFYFGLAHLQFSFG